MSDETKEYQEQLKKDGIDVEDTQEDVIEDETISGDFEDIKNPANEEIVETKTEDDEDDKKSKTDTKEKDDKDSTLSDTKETKVKRSIYDEYKGKKAELKTEKELREKVEADNSKLKKELEEAIEGKATKEDKEDAVDELDEFAKEIGASPDAIKKMRTLFLKGIKPDTDKSLIKDLKEFKEWKVQNNEIVAEQSYEKELKEIRPQLKKDFPNASDKEMEEVEKKIDEISHTTDFHDKTLDYVVFKNKETLSALVSPKKRGMETKERTDTETDDGFVFDPNVDLSKLSGKNQEKWQEHYDKMIQKEELMDDGKGGKILL